MRVWHVRVAGLAMLFSCGVLFAPPATAAETKVFTYDALGRLIEVKRSGSVNNGVVESYVYDPAGNRMRVQVAGSQNATPPTGGVVVLPLIGGLVIPLSGQAW